MKKSCFPSPWSCSDTPRSSGWVRWKADNLLLKFKKNQDEKYFFIMENFDFEKICFEIFYIGKIFFTKGIFEISKIFFKNFKKYFFKMKILHDEKIFFVRIFFKLQEKVVSFPTHPTRTSGSWFAGLLARFSSLRDRTLPN